MPMVIQSNPMSCVRPGPIFCHIAEGGKYSGTKVPKMEKKYGKQHSVSHKQGKKTGYPSDYLGVSPYQHKRGKSDCSGIRIFHVGYWAWPAIVPSLSPHAFRYDGHQLTLPCA